MEITFKTGRLRKQCNEDREAARRFGSDSAKLLNTRLHDLDAVANVRELVAGNPHPLVGDKVGEFAVNLAGGHRLVFIPSHNPVPEDVHGGTDWAHVTAVTIVFIGDYHD